MSTTSSPVPPSSGRFDADAQGWFGGPEQGWGGRFMPEALIAALDELTAAWPGATRSHAPSAPAQPARRVAKVTPPPALWMRKANLLKKTMNSDAVFEQLKKFRKWWRRPCF